MFSTGTSECTDASSVTAVLARFLAANGIAKISAPLYRAGRHVGHAVSDQRLRGCFVLDQRVRVAEWPTEPLPTRMPSGLGRRVTKSLVALVSHERLWLRICDLSESVCDFQSFEIAVYGMIWKSYGVRQKPQIF